MGLDPMSIGVGIATNIATDIIKYYAQRLEGTLVGRALKELGIIEKTRNDHLHEVLEEALQLYFKLHPLSDISGVVAFFHDPMTVQQIGNYIFDHQPTDQQTIEKALAQHLKSEAITTILMERRGVKPEQIIPQFLDCYRQVLKEHTDVAERAILLTVLDATDTVTTEIRASEERMKSFIVTALQTQRGDALSLTPGHVIGRYHVQRYLTTGTFGALYLAKQQDTETEVILKAISIPEGLRLHYDVFSLGTNLINLSHPSILPTLDINLDETPPYIVTAYATGGSLYDQIRRYQPQTLPLSEAITILSQIGNAVAYLHEQNIIHRGIQPASILFDNADSAQLTGFDLAIAANTMKHRLLSNQIGTINYMAPEQSHGIISEKADQYALGYLAYELCTGRPPFKEHSSAPTSQHQTKPPLAPRLFNYKISPQAERAILKALSVNPDQRYDNVSSFITALTVP